MPYVPISDLPAAIALSGDELTVIVQGGTTKQTTTGAISNFPVTTPSFVTTTANAGLDSERVLTGTANEITVTDNGANSTAVLSFAGGHVGTGQVVLLNGGTLDNTEIYNCNFLGLQGASDYNLVLSSGEVGLSEDRTLTFAVNNANRTLSLSGNLTTGGGFTTSGSSALTLTTTGTTNVTFPTSGTLATTSGASIPSVAQGDLLYGSATNVLSALAKNATATRYLSNTGTSNNPAWAQIALTTGVTGVLPVANGGTDASSASITAFNNITGYTAAGATGTTSTNLVFSTAPTLVTPALGAASATSVALSGNATGSADISVVKNTQAIQSGVTSSFASFESAPSTQAASFSLSNLFHYRANPGTVGAGSAVSNQYGVYIDSTMTGASNDYGFFSALGAASNVWAFYGSGTARSWFGGNVGIAASGYLNFSTTDGTSGYGVRDNSGVIEIKDSGGSWATPGTGSVASGTANQLAYYASSTNAVAGNANFTVSSGALTLGVAGSAQGSLNLSGVTSGTLTLAAPAAAGGVTITLPAGTTNFSATGGTSQVVKQTSAGGAFTVAQLAASDLSNGTDGSGQVVLINGSNITNPIITSPTINLVGLNSLGLYRGSGSFQLYLNNAETLAADRTLTFAVGSANRTISLTGDITTAGAFVTSGANSLTLTTTGTTNVTLPTSGTLVAQGGALGTPSSGTLTSCTGLPISTGVSGLGTGVATALAVNVGSAGAPVVFNGALGTPSSGTLTSATGLPISTGVSGLGSGVATFLATPSSTNLIAAVTGETGSGALVFGTAPTLTSAVLATKLEKGVFVIATSGVQVTHTGNTTETLLASATIPAGVMGANGRIRVTNLYGRNAAGAGTNTYKVYFSATNDLAGTVLSTSLTTTAQLSSHFMLSLQNRNATNSQVSSLGGSNSSGMGTNGSVAVTAAIDTTAAAYIVISGQLANSGDTASIESYLVELILP